MKNSKYIQKIKVKIGRTLLIKPELKLLLLNDFLSWDLDKVKDFELRLDRLENEFLSEASDALKDGKKCKASFRKCAEIIVKQRNQSYG
jgi:hypothetical protein